MIFNIFVDGLLFASGVLLGYTLERRALLRQGAPCANESLGCQDRVLVKLDERGRPIATGIYCSGCRRFIDPDDAAAYAIAKRERKP